MFLAEISRCIARNQTPSQQVAFPPFPLFKFLPPLRLPSQVFSATLSNLQVRNCLADVDSWRLFANLNELCLVRQHANTTASFTCAMQIVPPAHHITTAVFALFWNAAISSFGQLCNFVQKIKNIVIIYITGTSVISFFKCRINQYHNITDISPVLTTMARLKV